jgi:hypothetical protein
MPGHQKISASNSLLLEQAETPTVLIHLHESPCIIRHEAGMDSKYSLIFTNDQLHLGDFEEHYSSYKHI